MDSAMTEGTEEDSDGLDDAEFTAEHENYLQELQRHDMELLRLEEELQNVTFSPRKLLT